MRTHKIKLYKFDELSDESKQKALEGLGDINVGYEWWDTTFYDANMIGLKITAFELDRGMSIDGYITQDMTDVIKNIRLNHFSTETNAIADEYEARLNEIRLITLDDDLYDAEQDLGVEFGDELLEVYLSSLKAEYEYLFSDEAIIETIEANDYEFTADGKLF